MIRSVLIATCAAVLTACAEPRPAAAPVAEPEKSVPNVTQVDNGVIRVKFDIPDQDALAPLHCAAALEAERAGAIGLEWVGGIASPRSDGGYTADLAYETSFETNLRRLRADAEPADGGLVATQSWMTYCDEAGIPRAGEA